jgi:di/tricarboxylate transporter
MPTHFVGGIAITYFFRVGIVHAQEFIGRIPRSIQLVLSLGLTAVTAVVWELLEFLSDITFGTHMNLGVSDTLSDLLFGLLGALVVVVAGSLRSTRRRSNSVRASNEV